MPPPKVPRGKSLFRRRTLKLDGRPTSMSLEGAFWDALRDIAGAQGTTLQQLLESIHREWRERQQQPNFSSATRVFVLDYYRRRWESWETEMPLELEPRRLGLPDRTNNVEEYTIEQTSSAIFIVRRRTHGAIYGKCPEFFALLLWAERRRHWLRR